MGVKQGLGADSEEHGAQNLMNRGRELDLVAQDSPGLPIFIEVKTRPSFALGWMSTNPRGGYNSRFDVAGYIARTTREYSIDYCEGLL